jgi:hypothetical protein
MNDKNMNQGKNYLKYNNYYSDSGRVHMIPLQLTSSPKLGSISEAMHGNDSINASNNSTKMHISGNEEEFNKTLVEYSTLYNLYSEEVMTNNNNNIKNTNNKNNLSQHLQSLNNKLIGLADNINNEIRRLNVSDFNLKQHIDKQQAILSTYINQLQSENNKINEFDPLDTEIVLKSNKYNYVMWLILIIFLITIVVHIIANNSFNGIVLLISLAMIYVVSKYLYLLK